MVFARWHLLFFGKLLGLHFLTYPTEAKTRFIRQITTSGQTGFRYQFIPLETPELKPRTSCGGHPTPSGVLPCTRFLRINRTGSSRRRCYPVIFSPSRSVPWGSGRITEYHHVLKSAVQQSILPAQYHHVSSG